MTVKRKDLVGQKFGRMTVLAFSHLNKNRMAAWECKCDCGNTKVVVGKFLRSGETQSCGCFGKEQRAKANSKRKLIHGQTIGKNSRTYRIWANMVSRCTNPKFDSFPWYGGRGISVCQEWRTFSTFLNDMGIAPEGLTIDRINVNGNYCKQNCRWATWLEQASNKQKHATERLAA